MSKIYRCPKCDSTAIEDMWNNMTAEEVGGSVTTLEEARSAPHNEPWYHCPYCRKLSYFSELRTVQPRKFKREHFEEDEGLFEL